MGNFPYDDFISKTSDCLIRGAAMNSRNHYGLTFIEMLSFKRLDELNELILIDFCYYNQTYELLDDETYELIGNLIQSNKFKTTIISDQISKFKDQILNYLAISNNYKDNLDYNNAIEIIASHELYCDALKNENVDRLFQLINYGIVPTLRNIMGLPMSSIITIVFKQRDTNTLFNLAKSYKELHQLYKSGAQINSVLIYRGMTSQCNALIAKIRDNKFEACLKLIELRINVNFIYDNANTALHLMILKLTNNFIITSSFTNTFNKLIEYGAKVNWPNDEGNTPLHLAAQAGNINIIDVLIKAGADIEFVNHNGQTPLDLAKPKFKKQIEDKLNEHKPNYFNAIPYEIYYLIYNQLDYKTLKSIASVDFKSKNFLDEFKLQFLKPIYCDYTFYNALKLFISNQLIIKSLHEDNSQYLMKLFDWGIPIPQDLIENLKPEFKNNESDAIYVITTQIRLWVTVKDKLGFFDCDLIARICGWLVRGSLNCRNQDGKTLIESLAIRKFRLLVQLMNIQDYIDFEDVNYNLVILARADKYTTTILSDRIENAKKIIINKINFLLDYYNCLDFNNPIEIIAGRSLLDEAIKIDDNIRLQKLLRFGVNFTTHDLKKSLEKCKAILIDQNLINSKLSSLFTVAQFKEEGIQTNKLIADLVNFSEDNALTHYINYLDINRCMLMIEAGINVNHITKYGHSALTLAISKIQDTYKDSFKDGLIKLAYKLIDSKADVNHHKDNGETPLSLARQLKNENLISYLIKAGATDNYIERQQATR